MKFQAYLTREFFVFGMQSRIRALLSLAFPSPHNIEIREWYTTWLLKVLNQHLVSYHFKTKSLQSVLLLITQDCFHRHRKCIFVYLIHSVYDEGKSLKMTQCPKGKCLLPTILLKPTFTTLQDSEHICTVLRDN